MKLVLPILVGMSLLASAAHSSELIYDGNQLGLKTGDRAKGVICDFFGENRNPEFITHPELMVSYFERELSQSPKIMPFYESEKSGLVMVMTPPYKITPVKGVEVFHHNETNPGEVVVGGLVKVITLGAFSGNSSHSITTYKACINVEGTFDGRTGFQKLKDLQKKLKASRQADIP